MMAKTKLTYEREITALLVIDPYNDFISEGGKIWNRIRGVAEANNCVSHMQQVLNAARKAKLRIFYVMHRRYRPGDYETWKYTAPIQKRSWSSKNFEYGSWGGHSFRVRAAAGRHSRSGALVLQRICQHRPGSGAQETRHPSAHHHRTHRAYLRRGDRSLCC